jgi:Zn-finger nucleic acid-binding protein
MRKCPVCDIVMARVEYEGFVIMQCGQCRGHLLSLQRLESIKGVGKLTQDELKAEAAEDFVGDNPHRVKCPRCHMTMSKATLNIPLLDLKMDVCRECCLAWLDGGELAFAQLAHETTDRFIDSQELKRRMAELEASPERKAAFEARVAKLPDERGPIEEAAGDAATIALQRIILGFIIGPR